MFDWAWYDWIGIAGTLMLLFAYWLMQAGRLVGNGIVFQILNLVGAGCVLASLYERFNISVALLMGLWIVITLYGLVRTVKRGTAPKPPTPPPAP